MSHIARELKMLFYLNDHINRLVKISELSDLLEVTPRQVRRYRDDLEQCDILFNLLIVITVSKFPCFF